MNTLVISGNLTRDIEIRYSKAGDAFGTSAVAVNDFRAKDDKVTFIDIIAFGRTAEVMNQYLRKGSKVLLKGRLDLQAWITQNGEKRQKHQMIVEEMEMIGKPISQAGQNGPISTTGYPPQKFDQSEFERQNAAGKINVDITEDEIPF